MSSVAGSAGETVALRHLERAGLRLRERNLRVPYGEIDLVMDDPVTGELVFVEVRTRKRGPYGTAVDSLTAAKRRTLARSIQFAIADMNWTGLFRLDIVAVEYDRDGGGPAIVHIPYVSV